MTLRLIFMGTPAFSVPTLAAILEAGHDVCAVYSQPPRRAGRGMAETKGPVHAFAEAQGGGEVEGGAQERAAARGGLFAAAGGGGGDVEVV